MGKKSQTVQLKVFLQGHLVGEYKKTLSGETLFTYSNLWVKYGFPISQTLPLSTAPYKGNHSRAYFENLLPDSKEERDAIAAKMRAHSSDHFDLLRSIGRDCIGALRFTENTESDRIKANPPRGIVLSDAKIGQMIKNLQSHPLGMELQIEDFRISLAGVQEKTALLFWNNKWQRPIGTTPTTHIIKPAIKSSYQGRDMKTSVHNEYFCMKLCQKLGLRVANIDIKKFGEELVLVVERFDRLIKNGIIYRKHQEDMCQALGYFSGQKYQSDGGPSIKGLVSVLETSVNRQEDLETLFKSLAIYFVLGATDGHAKNYSIEYVKQGHKLAPLYDILSIFPTLSSSEMAAAKYKMALSMGISNHYRAHKINRKHFLETARICQMTENLANQIIDDILGQLKNEVWNEIEYSTLFDHTIKNKIVEGIKATLKRLVN